MWYVVSWHSTLGKNTWVGAPPSPEAKVWTLSEDPETTGWETDAGQEDYGLTKEKAQHLADAANLTAVFVLHREISDKYGTDEVVGVFTSRAKAEAFRTNIRDRRTFIREIPLDQSYR